MDEMATTQISKDELDELKEAFAKVGELFFCRVTMVKQCLFGTNESYFSEKLCEWLIRKLVKIYGIKF